MHVYGECEAGDQQIISLGRDAMPGNAGVLDLGTLRFEPSL